MLRRLIASVATSVVRRRRRWALVVLLVSIISAWVGSRLTLRLDIEDFQPLASGPVDPLEDEILNRFGQTSRIIVFLESTERLNVGEVAQIFEYLADRLRQVDGVVAVQYRVSPELQRFLDEHGPDRLLLYLLPDHLRQAGSRLSKEGIESALARREGIERAATGDDSTIAKLSANLASLKADPLGVIGLAQWSIRRVVGTSRVQLTDRYFSLPGGRMFFFTVQPEAGVEEIQRARVIVPRLERVLEDARSDAAVAGLLEGRGLFAVGRPVSYVHAWDTILEDARRVVAAAMIVILVALAVFFRRAYAPIVLMLPIVSGFAVTACLAVLLFPSVSLIAWIFIGLLVGLGVDFGIHVATHYWVYGESGAELEKAVASAVLRPGRGIVFGGLTSAAAFLSLQALSYPTMKQLAWLTGIGLVAIMVSSFTVLPIGLSHSAAARRSETVWHRWGAFFDRASRGNAFWGFALWVALAVATILAAGTVPFEPHPWKLAVRSNPKEAQLERLNRELGSAFTPLLMISRGATEEEAIARDREATLALRRFAQRAGVASIESVSRWLPPRENQLANLEFIEQNPELFSLGRFRRDFEEAVSRMGIRDPYLTEEYLPLLSRFLQPQQEELTLQDLRDLGLESEIDRHLLSSGGEYVAISHIYLRKLPWADGSVSRFLEIYERAGLNDLSGVSLLGSALRSASHPQTLRRDGLRATLIALVLVAGTLWIQFRSLRKAVLCLLPLVCGLSAAVLVMGVFRIELNMLTLAIAPILVGIGVDDGIHIVERLHAGETTATVLREAGSSMTMTTLTTVGAFACLGLASFGAVRQLGLVGSVGLVVCLLASLHLIPLCHRFLPAAAAR